LFTALTFQLCFVHTKLSSDYIAVLGGNGFLRDRDVKRMTQIFRVGAMAKMKENWQKYLPFLKDCSEAKFYIFLEEYSMSGQFAGDFGDLLSMACANFLGAVIVLFSSDPHYNCQTIVPQGTVLTEVPLQLAFSSYGPGHYKATVQMSKEVKADKEILLNKTLQNKSFICRCGANHRQLSTSMNEF
jgi:hypothetical protein